MTNKFKLGVSKVILASLVLIGVLLSPQVKAQSSDVAHLATLNTRSSLTLPAAGNSFGLLDLSKLRWRQSYGMSFFSSGSGAGSYGLYNSSFLYDLSPKLSLGLNLGIGHNPGILFDRTANANATILPSFNLDYHPSDKFRLSVAFDSYSGSAGRSGYYPYNSWGGSWSPWGSRDYGSPATTNPPNSEPVDNSPR